MTDVTEHKISSSRDARDRLVAMIWVGVRTLILVLTFASLTACDDIERIQSYAALHACQNLLTMGEISNCDAERERVHKNNVKYYTAIMQRNS